MNVLAELRDRFRTALAAMSIDGAEAVDLVQMVLPSQDAKFGDYQANLAMSLAKRLGKSPRDVAQQIVASLKVDDICAATDVAGPGFINLRLSDPWIVKHLSAANLDLERIGVPAVANPRTFVVDFSSPNVAKPMHVGHIRSTVIGDALNRILKFLGHQTISDNHLGDWGTQFGMIIYGYKHFVDEAALAHEPVAELSRLYKLVNTLVEYQVARSEKLPAVARKIVDAERGYERLRSSTLPLDPKEAKKEAKRLQHLEGQLADLRRELSDLQQRIARVDGDPDLAKLATAHAEIGRQVLLETARLHSGDVTNVELWRRFLPACLADVEAVYQRLNVTFDHTLGESFYQDRLRGVVKDLSDKGLVRESDGALCVFLDGFDTPMIVQKQDGAFLYATTDLATIQYRTSEWRPDVIVYVVDHRQSLHFEQFFAAARLWGYRDVDLQHVAFGTVLGEDGRPFKTRSGTSVGLAGLLDEAVERAYAIVCQNDNARPQPLLSVEQRRQVAERVGIGAIKYADLAHNRTSDYVFSYDKMLAMTGNTAAYMQYSYARVRSIFEKGNVDALRLPRAGASPPPAATDVSSPGSNTILLTTPQERALAVALLQFAEALDRVVNDYRPNHLTAYLFDLASRYSDFFENCPVLRAESDELRTSRLILCDLTARTLERGLNLLGIEVVERM